MSDLTSWVREISTGVIVKILITMIVAALAFLVAYARGFRLRLPFTRHTVVQIVSPGNGAAVGSRGTVRGTIQPPGPVRVFALANDNYWYLQNRPQVIRDAWNGSLRSSEPCASKRCGRASGACANPCRRAKPVGAVSCCRTSVPS